MALRDLFLGEQLLHDFHLVLKVLQLVLSLLLLGLKLLSLGLLLLELACEYPLVLLHLFIVGLAV